MNAQVNVNRGVGIGGPSHDQLQQRADRLISQVGTPLREGLVDRLKANPSVGRIENIYKSQDDLIQEKLLRILQAETGHPESSLNSNLNTRYSELSKIQAVKACGGI